MPLAKEGTKLEFVDALRGLAILGVIMVHTSQYSQFSVPYPVSNIIKEGARGVQLFYLTSAFTLFLSLSRRINCEKSPIRNFILRRLFRIVPMYYIGVGYYIWQDGLGPRYWLGDAAGISTFNIISNLAFLHGVSPYWITSLVPGGWSIAVEMMFYCFLPILFLRLHTLNQAFAFFLYALAARLFLHLLLKQFPLVDHEILWGNYLFLYFPSQLPVFCLGIVLFFIVVKKQSLKTVSGASILVFSALVLAQLAVGIPFAFPNHVVFSMGFLLLAIGLSASRCSLVVNPVISYFGKISFSMYLTHFAVLHWLGKLGVLGDPRFFRFEYIGRLSLVLAATTVISAITYNLVEVPAQKIGQKVINGLEKNKDC